ncbi:hypothetical protein KJZ99_08045 [bacterium]|nr:hypothetical protein [bacterium]
MQGLTLVLAICSFLATSNAQTFCVTATGTCCVEDYTIVSDTTIVQINDLAMTFDAGSANHRLHIVLQIDGFDQESWTVCGCGEREVQVDPIGPNHVVSLKARCTGCDSPCSAGEGKASVYAPASSVTCKLPCN